MDPKQPVTDLLRRVKFTAAKLGLGKIEDWVEQELNGYDGMPPDYRVVHGIPMARHPYRGWEEIGGEVEWLSKRPNNQAISSIESIAVNATKTTRLHMPFPDKITAELNRLNGSHGWNCALVCPPSEMFRILDKVRNLVLDWAINLQKAGIMGSEVNFNDAEKEKAQSASTTINIGSIGNFAGNIGQGNVSGHNSIQIEQVQSILDQLKPHLPALSAAGAGDNLTERIHALENAIKDKKADTSIIRGFIIDLRNTLTGAAGNLIASGAISALNLILGTGVPR